MQQTKAIRCGNCNESHGSVDAVRQCHSGSLVDHANGLETDATMPNSLRHRRRGEPRLGDELVSVTFNWEYWCDLCGTDLQNEEAIYRPSRVDHQAGGWCKECAYAYDFSDLHATSTTTHDPDEIRAIYHFTDTRNVGSIEEHGILAHDVLLERGITPHMSSTENSRALDRQQGLSGFVRLTLHPHHPMAWKALYDKRTPELTWLKIHASVLQGPSTQYSNTNALTSGRTVRSDSKLATRGTDQAEAMVPFVPTIAILEILPPISI